MVKLKVITEQTRKFRSDFEESLDALEENLTRLLERERRLIKNDFSTFKFFEIAAKSLNHSDIDWIKGTIGTIGDGPWELEEVDNLLLGMRFDVSEIPQDDIQILVIGRNNYSKEIIEEHIKSYATSQLIILSQELLLLGILTNKNPLSFFDNESLSEYSLNHPGIQYALSVGFEWPRTSVSIGEIYEWESDAEFSEKSPLREMGYSAKMGGPSESERREILEDFLFITKPPLVDTPEEIKRWGRAGTNQRLYSMAKFIGWLIRFKGASSELAAVKWQSDLDWLKSNFYKSTMKFGWPEKPRKPEFQKKTFTNSRRNL